ncbi:MAG: enoyl-CoA hydratase [Desulfobacterales bacterium]|nr:MAG: enoyl-CoA hydratase [Desulfobacterales bacterium]UCD89787.1 MAG: enoyl-CoA hydratase [Desulfobacterales bacterium]
MQPVIFEKDGPIGWLTLNRPEKRNALSLEMMDDMLDKLHLLAKDESIRIAVIRGNGPGFCAGHDLNEMTGPDIHANHFHRIFSLCAEMMQTLNALPQPVIAQVHGVATAAGLQLVAACDLAIAETGARFATPGVKIGLFCSTPAVPLVRAIGRKRAIEMLISGRFVSAKEAETYGLVHRIVAPDKLAEQTRAWAMELAEYSRYTLAFGKQTFYKQIDLDAQSAYDYASNAMVMNCLAEDAQEGMTAFLEKRKAEWKHR